MIKECERTIATAAKSFPPGISHEHDLYRQPVPRYFHSKGGRDADRSLYPRVDRRLYFPAGSTVDADPGYCGAGGYRGTFFFLKLFGFTINLLTLFALVLAIGIVVDDAIVVVEAVHAKLDQHVPTARQATIEAMSEISGAVVSITLVMAAVFIPVTFITGSVGVFYKQFGLTLAVAILISALNALTLSPALCALLLRRMERISCGRVLCSGSIRLSTPPMTLRRRNTNGPFSSCPADDGLRRPSC